MSNETSVPIEDAHDGERDGTRHIPRDPRDDAGTTAAARPGPGAVGEALDAGHGKLPGVRDSTEDVTRDPGPAEERDSETPNTPGPDNRHFTQ